MYILEGTIGAGKSTFLTLLKKKMPEIKISYEPLSAWSKDIGGQSLLKNFYRDMSRWAYTLETTTLLTNTKEHIHNQNIPDPIIAERSVYSGRYCFALANYRNGSLSPLEWDLYCSWFDYLVPGRCLPPRGFIYLKVDPDIAFERIHKRDRISEEPITGEYLKELDQCYDDFLIKKIDILPELHNVPVLVLDCNKDFVSDNNYFDKLCGQVKKFLKES